MGKSAKFAKMGFQENVMHHDIHIVFRRKLVPVASLAAIRCLPSANYRYNFYYSSLTTVSANTVRFFTVNFYISYKLRTHNLIVNRISGRVPSQTTVFTFDYWNVSD